MLSIITGLVLNVSVLAGAVVSAAPEVPPVQNTCGIFGIGDPLGYGDPGIWIRGNSHPVFGGSGPDGYGRCIGLSQRDDDGFQLEVLAPKPSTHNLVQCSKNQKNCVALPGLVIEIHG